MNKSLDALKEEGREEFDEIYTRANKVTPYTHELDWLDSFAEKLYIAGIEAARNALRSSQETCHCHEKNHLQFDRLVEALRTSLSENKSGV